MESKVIKSKKFKQSAIAVVVGAALSSVAHSAVTFTELPNETWGGDISVSNDGTVVYTGDYNLYKWSAQSGLTSLKSVNWGRVSGAYISDDSSVIGFTNVTVENEVLMYGAAVVYKNGVERIIPASTIQTGQILFQGSMSADGKYLTGMVNADAAYMNLENDTVNVYDDTSDVNYVVVAGTSYNGEQKFLKAANGYTPDAYYVNGDNEPEYVDLTYSWGMSANGQAMIGERWGCTEVETVGNNICAISWNTDTKQYTELGYFRPTSVNRDATIVTGNGWSDDPGAKVWDTFNGTRDLRDILASHNIDVNGWSSFGGLSVSSDGTKIVGHGINPQGQKKPFLVNIIPECVGF